MEKRFLTSAVILTFSGLAMANNQNSKLIVLNKKELISTDKTTSSKEDEIWFCYLASTETSDPDMAGNTTTTEIHHCTWY
ncbi:hypothetical protein LNQ49_10190 [Flavobacterium sp. F-65]|uniref:Uncharacterized protein n=1 Tax=Flavobacterium pisciphilum TaxID=2893755 RepID=A0ABS8MT35_9FLAO|nr:hypothetical protein [Flavobacterium sp. F-65]MCC9071950.1 hypothetical protein [Flavobacterium sp. F-65]